MKGVEVVKRLHSLHSCSWAITKGMMIMRHTSSVRTVRLVTWSIQTVIALGLALVASLAVRGLGIMLIAASVGVLIASGVGLGVRVSEDDTRTERDE